MSSLEEAFRLFHDSFKPVATIPTTMQRVDASLGGSVRRQAVDASLGGQPSCAFCSKPETAHEHTGHAYIPPGHHFANQDITCQTCGTPFRHHGQMLHQFIPPKTPVTTVSPASTPDLPCALCPLRRSEHTGVRHRFEPCDLENELPCQSCGQPFRNHGGLYHPYVPVNRTLTSQSTRSKNNRP